MMNAIYINAIYSKRYQPQPFKMHRTYTEEQKSFAIMLQLYWLKTHEYLRMKLKDRLSSLKTTQK